jgi:hypothetical protein
VDERHVSVLKRSGAQPDGASRQRLCAVYGRLSGVGPDAVEIADGQSGRESGDGGFARATAFGQDDHSPHRTGFDFLVYRFSAVGQMVARQKVARCVAPVSQLYERGAASSRIETYVQRWARRV